VKLFNSLAPWHPVWQKGTNCTFSPYLVAKLGLSDTAGKEQHRGKLSYVGLALISQQR